MIRLASFAERSIPWYRAVRLALAAAVATLVVAAPVARAQRFADPVDLWTRPPGSTGSAGSAFIAPSVATDGHGTWLAAWSQPEGHAVDRVMTARSTDGGTGWDPHPLSADGTVLAVTAAMSDDGTAAVAWIVSDAPNRIRVATAVNGVWHESPSDATGVLQAAAASGPPSAAHLHWSASRGWLLVWTTDDPQGTAPSRVVAAGSADGVTWRAPVTVAAADRPGARFVGPSAATDAGGTSVVVWARETSDHDGVLTDAESFSARAASGSDTWEAPVAFPRLDPAAPQFTRLIERHPSLAVDGHRWMAAWEAWQTKEPSIPNVSVASVIRVATSEDGSTWTPPVAATQHFWDAHQPVVMAYGAGRWLLVWDSETPRLALRASRSDDGGSTWVEHEEVGRATTPIPYFSDFPRLVTAAATDAHVVVAWRAEVPDGVLTAAGDGICGDGTLTAGEACDDGNLTDGDGCDANCTPTGCGNGIVTTGEDCDPTPDVPQQCCDETCRFSAAGSACSDDGNVCTDDLCDDAGTCTHPANHAPCDDHDSRTQGDACDAGVCRRGGLRVPHVRMVYAVPSDGAADPLHVATLEAAMRHVQAWLKHELGDGRSIALDSPAVTTVALPHPASWYTASAPGDDQYAFETRLAADALGALPDRSVRDSHIIAPETDVDCGRPRALFYPPDFAVVSSATMRGLGAPTGLGECGDAGGVAGCAAVGRIAWAVGAFLGLHAPDACSGDHPPPLCATAISAFGLNAYPDAHLLPADVDAVAWSHLLSPAAEVDDAVATCACGLEPGAAARCVTACDGTSSCRNDDPCIVGTCTGAACQFDPATGAAGVACVFRRPSLGAPACAQDPVGSFLLDRLLHRASFSDTGSRRLLVERLRRLAHGVERARALSARAARTHVMSFACRDQLRTVLSDLHARIRAARSRRGGGGRR